MRSRPLPEQRDLFKRDSTARRKALRGVPCVEPLDKLVLYVLEGHIDPSKGYWDGLSVGELAAEVGVSESTCRRILNRLDTDPRCTFIYWERQRGKKPKFWIVWGNIDSAISDRQAAARSATADGTQEASSVTCDRTLADSSATSDTKFRQIEGGSSVIAVTEPLNKDLTDLTDINRPPTDLVGEVAACGVVKAFETVATARAIGYSDDQIREVVSHYRAFPGRWRSAGALSYRLAIPGSAKMPPDQGWPPDSPGWRPVANQAATDVDAIIHNMTIDQIRSAIPEHERRIQELRLSRAYRSKGIQTDPDIYAALRQKLAGAGRLATAASLANTS